MHRMTAMNRPFLWASLCAKHWTSISLQTPHGAPNRCSKTPASRPYALSFSAVPRSFFFEDWVPSLRRLPSLTSGNRLHSPSCPLASFCFSCRPRPPAQICCFYAFYEWAANKAPSLQLLFSLNNNKNWFCAQCIDLSTRSLQLTWKDKAVCVRRCCNNCKRTFKLHNRSMTRPKQLYKVTNLFSTNNLC